MHVNKLSIIYFAHKTMVCTINTASHTSLTTTSAKLQLSSHFLVKMMMTRSPLLLTHHHASTSARVPTTTAHTHASLCTHPYNIRPNSFCARRYCTKLETLLVHMFLYHISKKYKVLTSYVLAMAENSPGHRSDPARYLAFVAHPVPR